MGIRVLVLVSLGFEEHSESLPFPAASAELRVGVQLGVLLLCVMRDLSVLCDNHAISAVLGVVEAIEGTIFDLKSAKLLGDVCVALRLRHTELFELRVVPIAVRHGRLLDA